MAADKVTRVGQIAKTNFTKRDLISTHKEEELKKRKYCGICGHYDAWFGDCFAKEDGAGDPLMHNFRNDNFGNRGGLCDLWKPR